jgi:hypothetical protein
MKSSKNKIPKSLKSKYKTKKLMKKRLKKKSKLIKQSNSFRKKGQNLRPKNTKKQKNYNPHISASTFEQKQAMNKKVTEQRAYQHEQKINKEIIAAHKNINVLSGGGSIIPPIGIGVLLTPIEKKELQAKNIPIIEGIVPASQKLYQKPYQTSSPKTKPSIAAIPITQDVVDELVEEGIQSIILQGDNYQLSDDVTPLFAWVSRTVPSIDC